MRLTRRGEQVAIAAVSLWTAAAVFQSTVAALSATLLSAALAVALFRAGSPEITAIRILPGAQFEEGNAFREKLECSLRSPRRARVTLRELGSVGLIAETPNEGTFSLSTSTTQTIDISWRAQTWGRHTIGPAVLLLRDSLGLVEEQIEIAPSEQILVKPKSARLGKFAAPARRASAAVGAYAVSRPGDGGEFFALRPYQAGDSIRRINWKASVRGGDTIVNQVSHENYAKVLVVVDLRDKERVGDDAETVLIRNGRAAAAICDHHRRLRDHVNLLLLADDASLASRSANPGYDELLGALAAAPPGGSVDAAAALRRHVHLIKPKSPIYFCTSGALDAHLLTALRTVSTLGARAIVVSPSPPQKATAWAEYGTSRETALAGIRALGVRVVDWSNGGSLEVALANR